MAAALVSSSRPRGRSLAAEATNNGCDSHLGSCSQSCVAVPTRAQTQAPTRAPARSMGAGDSDSATLGNADHQPGHSHVSPSPSPAPSTGPRHSTRTRAQTRSQSLPNLFADGHGGGGVWPSHWASQPPQQYVDYLHHPWTDDDLTNSWKLITKLKHSDRALKLGGKGERLEYLTWRIWIQRTRRLPKTHPYTIHWEKDSSHLYAPGPIFRGKSCFHLLPADLPSPSSPVPSGVLSTPPLSPSSRDHSKSCLKRQTLRDILLRPRHSSHSPHFVLSDPPSRSVARRRKTLEEHEQLMRNALATASSGDDLHQPQQLTLSGDPLASPDPSADCRVLVCTATASHPALNLDTADTQVVRFNHVIEERVIAGPSRTVVVASRKRRSRSLVMAVLDGNEAKAYKRVVDKWVGLDASKPLPTTTTSRGRPRSRSDPPIATVPAVSSARSTARASSRSIQDSAIAFSALVDDLLSSPENEDVASFAGSPLAQSPPTSRSSTPTHSPTSPSSSSQSPPLAPSDNVGAASTPPATCDLQTTNPGGTEPTDDIIDDDRPTWERSTLARGRDHALPPFHVDESTLAMLALPYAVGIPPPAMSAAHAPQAELPHAVDLPTPPPSSPVAAPADMSEQGTAAAEVAPDLPDPVTLPGRPISSTRLGSPPRRKPREPQVLARVVARGTGWGIGHLDECELGSRSSLGLESAATEDEGWEQDETVVAQDKADVFGSPQQSNASLKEAVANVADAVGWLVDMVAGRAGLFST